MVLDNWHLIAVGYVQFYLEFACCCHFFSLFCVFFSHLVDTGNACSADGTICCSSVLIFLSWFCTSFLCLASFSCSNVCVSHVCFTKCCLLCLMEFILLVCVCFSVFLFFISFVFRQIQTFFAVTGDYFIPSMCIYFERIWSLFCVDISRKKNEDIALNSSSYFPVGVTKSNFPLRAHVICHHASSNCVFFFFFATLFLHAHSHRHTFYPNSYWNEFHVQF